MALGTNPGGPRDFLPPAHTHRDQRFKEAVEKQVPQGLALVEVGHEPDEEVGDDGQGCGEDDPEEGESLSGDWMSGLAWTLWQPHRVPGGKEIPPSGSTHPGVSGKVLMANPGRPDRDRVLAYNPEHRA